jgi:hypothetical protein
MKPAQSAGVAADVNAIVMDGNMQGNVIGTSWGNWNGLKWTSVYKLPPAGRKFCRANALGSASGGPARREKMQSVLPLFRRTFTLCG